MPTEISSDIFSTLPVCLFAIFGPNISSMALNWINPLGMVFASPTWIWIEMGKVWCFFREPEAGNGGSFGGGRKVVLEENGMFFSNQDDGENKENVSIQWQVCKFGQSKPNPENDWTLKNNIMYIFRYHLWQFVSQGAETSDSQLVSLPRKPTKWTEYVPSLLVKEPWLMRGREIWTVLNTPFQLFLHDIFPGGVLLLICWSKHYNYCFPISSSNPPWIMNLT